MSESVEHHSVGINGATSQKTKAAIHQNYHKTFQGKKSINITTKRGEKSSTTLYESPNMLARKSSSQNK